MDTKLKVLIVEDDELSRDYLSFFFRNKFEVYTAGSVDSFYNIIAKIDFNLIFMDVSLRDRKDGIELITELRTVPKYKDTPILIISAFGTTKIINAAKAAGANRFLTKPITAKNLLSVIDEVINKNNFSTLLSA